MNIDIPPLDVTVLPGFLPAVEPVQSVQPHEVCMKLLSIDPFKAHGPDNVPCRILKEFAYELAEPVTGNFQRVACFWNGPFNLEGFKCRRTDPEDTPTYLRR